MRTKLTRYMNSAAGKVSAVGAGLLASTAALAQTSSPGSAIAAELSGGKSDVMLVVSAAAIIIGLLVLWAYVKRAK